MNELPVHLEAASLLPLLIPIFGIVFTFGTPVVLVFMLLRYRLRKSQAQQEAMRMFLEAGKPIPDALFTEPRRSVDADRGRGILGIALGLGIMTFFLAQPDPEGWGIGAIPLFVGIGYLLSWWLDRRDRRNPATE